MNGLKKWMALLLAVCLLLTVAACGQSPAPESTPSSQGESSSSSSDADVSNSEGGDEESQPSGDDSNPWAGIVDTSKEETMVLYVFGTEPNDKDRVLDLINERLMELINTKIELNFIPLSDFPTKYPLLMTGGDEMDLVYCSSWTNFSEHASKSAYLELTDDFISTYMPKTKELEPQAAWDQIELKGKIYAVPRNHVENQTYGGFLIRKDIREQLNIPEIKTFEDYENFLFACADNIDDAYGLYAFPSMCGYCFNPLLIPFENIFAVGGGMYWDVDKGDPTPENLEYFYTMEEYKNFCLRMAEWAKRGVWPSNAITGTVHTEDLFQEGKSLSYPVRVPESNNLLENMRKKGYDVEFVTLKPENTYARLTTYSGDCMAISSFSKNPERAAVTLDILKNDEQVNLLCVGGIEGVHYILNDDGTRSNGPEADNYGWDGWTWSIRNNWNPQLKRLPEVQEILDYYDSQVMPDEMWPFDGFTFDDTNVSAENAVIQSIITEHAYSFDLGVYGDDTEAKYEEFVQQLNDAGLEKVIAEVRSQVAEHIASRK